MVPPTQLQGCRGVVAELNHAIQQIAETPERWPRYKANTRRYIFSVYPFSLSTAWRCTKSRSSQSRTRSESRGTGCPGKTSLRRYAL